RPTFNGNSAARVICTARRPPDSSQRFRRSHRAGCTLAIAQSDGPAGSSPASIHSSSWACHAAGSSGSEATRPTPPEAPTTPHLMRVLPTSTPTLGVTLPPVARRATHSYTSSELQSGGRPDREGGRTSLVPAAPSLTVGPPTTPSLTVGPPTGQH